LFSFFCQDLVNESEAWAKQYVEQQKKNDQQQPCFSVDDDSCVNPFAGATSSGALAVAQAMLQFGTPSEREYVMRVIRDGDDVHENCLVDNWVSHDRFDRRSRKKNNNNKTTKSFYHHLFYTFFYNRFAFIDLSAGPFEWGPAIAGEGIRSRFTLPKVPSKQQLLNDQLKGLKERKKERKKEEEEEQATIALFLLFLSFFTIPFSL
jgi:hypothetical protein